MDTRGIMDKIILARLRVAKEATACKKQGEGKKAPSDDYAAGYRDALDDVFMLLNDTLPSRKNYWIPIDDR
jgi:hypothetical protein